MRTALPRIQHTPAYWNDRELPDGTPLPHTAVFHQGVVVDWTGATCVKCGGDGKIRTEHYNVTCGGCGGTGEGYAPTWRFEE